MQSVAVEVAGGSYLIPATPEIEYKWAAYNPESGILQLRPIANLAAIECFYFVQHNSSAVTLEVLGGGVITAGNWWLQCTASARDGAAMARHPPTVARLTPLCHPTSTSYSHAQPSQNSSYAAMANVSTPACIPLAPPRDLSPRNTTVVFSGAPPVSPIPIASSARSESLLAATLAFAVLVSAMAC